MNDTNTKNYAQLLTAEWKEWVIKNLRQGVPPQNLADTLFEQGMMDAALSLLRDFKMPTRMPMLDLSQNCIHLADKSMPIVFTCQKPYVVVIDDFLSKDECARLIAAADNKFFDASVVDNNTGNFVQHKDRTSMNASFKRGENDIVQLIEERIARLLHWPTEHGEPIQILRYKDGGEYKAHFDYFDANTVGGQKQMQKGGQRVGTFLMYLSDVEAGGATRFPNVGFEVRPKIGSALYFANTLPSQKVNPLTLHASIPVVSGTKYIATKWLREMPYV